MQSGQETITYRTNMNMDKTTNNEMPLATCDVCRGLGGCLLGYRASWRYDSSEADPFTGFGRTKMDVLTKPQEMNDFQPPVKAFGQPKGARFIVGASMCLYIRSQAVAPREKMDPAQKKARAIKRQPRTSKAALTAPAKPVTVVSAPTAKVAPVRPSITAPIPPPPAIKPPVEPSAPSNPAKPAAGL